MSQREQIKGAIREGLNKYGEAFTEELASRKAIKSTHLNLSEAIEGLGKVVSGLQDAESDLEQACSSNGKAVGSWAEAFGQLILAGATESGRERVIHSVKDANSRHELLGARQPMLQAHHEKIASLIGTLQEALQYLRDEAYPDLTTADQLSKEFVNSSVQIDGEWQGGAGRVNLSSLQHWEASI